MAIRQLAWPRAMHGIAAVHLGKNHFAKLRTGAMQGLKVSRIGANPMLQLASWSPSTDPEFWAIVDTCRDARSQGNHEQLRCMMQQFSLCPQDVPFNGPTCVLVARLQRIGWQVTPSGTFRDQFGECDVLTMHWDALKARLTWAWPLAMAASVSHRSSYEGMQSVDRARIAEFGEADQVFLRCGLDGTLYHEKKKEKSNRGQGSTCEFCGLLDSFRHRLWECEYFASARASFVWTSDLPQLPSCLSCHGWAVTPQSWPHLVHYFEEIAPPAFVVPASSPDQKCHLFTDGACSFPKEPKLRYASFAVTIAGTSQSTIEHRVLQVGHVPGHHQTAYRGELWAMLVAIRYASQIKQNVCVWSDNQSVVTKLRAIQDGMVVKPNASHADLWSEIRHLMAVGVKDRLTVCKVVSHGSHHSALTDVEEWAFWHNALVDRAAGDYNEKRPDFFWNIWQSVVDELTVSRKIHRAVLQVILQIGRLGVQFDRVAQGSHENEQQERSGGLEGDSNDNAPSHVPAQWSLSSKLIKHCQLSNLNKLQHWWMQWGVPQLSSANGLQWISGLQLYTDYLLETRRHGPVMVRGKWMPGDVRVLQDHRLTTSRRVKMFLTMWKAMVGDNGMSMACKLCRPSSAAIAFWCQSYRLVWNGDRLKMIDDVLMKVLRRQIVKPQELDHVDLVTFLP